MQFEESLMGIRRSDPSELKPLKLHLPLNYVLALHRLRIVGERSVSEIVAEALNTYFEDLKNEKREAEILVR